MVDTVTSPRSVVAIVLGVIAAVLIHVLMIKAGPRWQSVAFGVWLICIGAISALTGTVRQARGAAPALTGPVATGIGVCIFLVGILVVFLGVRRTPGAEGQPDHGLEQEGPPRGGPATPSGKSAGNGEPPSAS